MKANILYIVLLICLIGINSYAYKVVHETISGNIVVYETDKADYYVDSRDGIEEINGSYGTYIYDWNQYSFGYVSNIYVGEILITNISQATYYQKLFKLPEVTYLNSSWSNNINILQNQTNIWNNKANTSITNNLASTNWVLSLNRITNAIWSQGRSNNVSVSDNVILITFNTNNTFNTNYYISTARFDTAIWIPRPNPPTPAEQGMVYFDSDDKKLKVYDGTAWRNLN